MRMPVVDLYCLPCAGASATMYLRWRRLVPCWVNVVPVELPGRGMRLGEPFEEDFQALVSRLCDEIAHGTSGRWAIFGHSMGALLAYGITLRLQSMRTSMPVMLFASGSPAPSHRDPDRIPDTDDDTALIADLRRQGGTPQEVFDSPELLRLTLDTLRADYRVCRSLNYCRNELISVPIQVFAGRHDAIQPHSIGAWWDEAGSSFVLHWFDGGHFFIREHERQVLRIVERSLGQLVGEGCHARTVSA